MNKKSALTSACWWLTVTAILLVAQYSAAQQVSQAEIEAQLQQLS